MLREGKIGGVFSNGSSVRTSRRKYTVLRGIGRLTMLDTRISDHFLLYVAYFFVKVRIYMPNIHEFPYFTFKLNSWCIDPTMRF